MGIVFPYTKCIRADLALEIATRFRYLVGKRDKDGMTAFQLLSCNPKAFERVRRRGFLKRISGKGKYRKVYMIVTT